MRRIATFLAGLSLGLLVASGASAVLQDISLGDRVNGQIGSSGIDTVELQFFAVLGTRLDLNVNGSATLEPAVRLLTSTGSVVDLGPSLKDRGRKVRVRKYVIAETGTYIFEITADAGSGSFRARTKGRFPKKFDLAGSFPDEPLTSLDAMPGAELRATVKAERGSSYEPTIETVVDGGGPLTLEKNQAKGSKAQFRRAVADEGGTVTMAVGGSGTGPYTARLRVKTPRSKQTFDVSAPPPEATGSLAGTVTNLISGAPVAGVAVSLDPPVPGVDIVTDASGAYSATDLPTRRYTIEYTADDFEPRTRAATVIENETAQVDVILEPEDLVIVTTELSSGTPAPEAALNVTASVENFDGSTFQSITWSQTHGAAATLSNTDMATANVTLADLAGYKDELIHILQEPPISEEDLPPNVPLPPGEFPGGLPDRFQVVGINPFALERTAEITLLAEVTTSSGTYTSEIHIPSPLPWKPTSGLGSVGIDVPVVLHGRSGAASYDWALSPPGGSSATLRDPTSQSPDFTPDVPGMYEITVTDPADGMPTTLEMYAGTWLGVIEGQDSEGHPVVSSSCDGCHGPGSSVPGDMVTPWSQTGHAAIFTDNLNTLGFYNPGCFPCHGVGFDPNANNAGMDDAPDYGAFLGSGLLGSPSPDNWTHVLADYPATAKLANVQCENCHGPQTDGGHRVGDLDMPEQKPRISYSANDCATCHGEPLRHARFQQWQLSAHANYELAESRGTSDDCGRCHSVNGFLRWLPILLGDEPGDPTQPLEPPNQVSHLSSDEIEPQTCVTCHDPHSTGTVSGLDTDATVRISPDTPLLIAGFTATDVGRGAICMTCHNSRRGLHNDATFDQIDPTRAPHGSAQADVLMGENAFLVSVGDRGPHSEIEDSCVSCHMELTPPPDALSYNQGGTNHTFFASPSVCSSCHGPEVEDTDEQTEERLDALETRIESAFLDLITALTLDGKSVRLGEDLEDRTITDASEIVEIQFGESRGRQAITVTFDDASEVGPTGVNSVLVLEGAVELGALYDFADEALPKSGWNWALIHNDGSSGAHYPGFARLALDSAIRALDALP
jgi:hypothetical protein